MNFGCTNISENPINSTIKAFSACHDCQWQGSEEATFGLLYSKLLNRWEELKAEY